MADSYFEDVVLPSVGLPLKNSYNMREACKILDCHYCTLASLAQKDLIKITAQKKIYAQEFANFFARNHVPKTKKTGDTPAAECILSQ